MHTHALDAFDISPRLAITSPEKGCGKTTLLDLIGHVVPRPLPTSNATPAVIFRSIEAGRPTLLIDEADTFLAGRDELRGILNSGHRRSGAFVLRCEGDNHDPRRWSTWAPIVIAMIGRLPDTLEDRSIGIRLRRKRRDERTERFRADRNPELEQLAQDIARWAETNLAAIGESDPELPEALQNRTADNWRPLIAIADIAGGDWPQHARHIAERSVAARKEATSEGAMLLEDIRILFMREGASRLASADLVLPLIQMEGRPWSDLGYGRELTPNSLARLLRPYGIRPRTVRDGKHTFKGYMRDDFADAFERYLAPLAPETVTPSQDG